jgi:hypothetical protein
VQQTSRVVVCKCGQVEEAGDVIDVEQMHFVGAARETDRDDRHARKKRIAFPRFQLDGGQQVVLAEHDVGSMLAGGIHRIHHTDDTPRVDSELPEELAEMIAQVAMPTDTQRLQCAHSLNTGGCRFRPVTYADEGFFEWYLRTMRLVQSEPEEQSRPFVRIMSLSECCPTRAGCATEKKLTAISYQLGSSTIHADALRQRQAERAALPTLRRHAQLAAEEHREALGDRETETCAAKLL